ncbi:MAG: RNA 2',3'-cyclic phosphodiesterase [Candidatus Hydrogenedentes bacterium]|nr:RNA 2',3'-cyclic phosphodiesterase [Candidatus Hydrogenedentota bacterium]
MRTFIAIELPETVKVALCELSERLRHVPVRASWAKPEAMHLTLRFLGDLESGKLAPLFENLAAEYSGTRPFELKVRSTGAFPNLRHPSVLWVGVEPPDGPLATVQNVAEQAARAIGLSAEKNRFHPHVTIARIKDEAGSNRLVSLLLKEKEFEGGAFPVNGVSLFSSQLTPHGPIHQRLKEFPFQ